MIVVRVELWSAITGQKTELARMEICNTDNRPQRLRNYMVRTLWGRNTITLNDRRTQREGIVNNHPAEATHIWNLVAKALSGMGYGQDSSR